MIYNIPNIFLKSSTGKNVEKYSLLETKTKITKLIWKPKAYAQLRYNEQLCKF